MTFKEYQAGLIRLGYDLGRAGADGIPGSATNAATLAFKAKHGLAATTTVGPQTVAALNAELAALGSPPVSDTPPPPVWIVEARRYLGLAEVAGARSNPTILGWAQRLGAKVVGMAFTNDDTPWCGLFVAAVISRALPSECLPAVVVRAASWDAFGRHLNQTAFGCVVRFQRPGGGHVGFAIGRSADGRLIRVLGGNQSNRVSETWIEKARLVECRWPSSINSPPIPLPIMDAKGVTISRDEA